MLIIVTLILSFLVALNFLLLIFSCNKTTKKTSKEIPTVYRTSNIKTAPVTKQLTSTQLAPTGS